MDHSPRQYTQAMMDLGATLCSRSKPGCGLCPLAPQCKAHAQGREKDFPYSKPKKDKPVKETVMLMLRAPDGQILLRQRPQTGIWGGLYSFPEIAQLEDTQSWLATHQADTAETEVLDSFRHTFSHYHLDITPVLVRLSKPLTAVGEATEHWYNPEKPSEIGLAAPVKKLLDVLAHTD